MKLSPILSIALLLLVSVTVAHAFPPYVKSVEISIPPEEYGNAFQLIVKAESNYPVTGIGYVTSAKNQASGVFSYPNLFVQTGTKEWTAILYILTSNMRDGIWSFNQVYVVDQYGLLSMPYLGIAPSIHIENGLVYRPKLEQVVVSRPILEQVLVSKKTFEDGEPVILSFVAESEVPVVSYNVELQTPSGSLKSSGKADFKKVESGFWIHTEEFPISPWEPSGTYQINSISVKGKGGLRSNILNNGPEFIVQNSNTAVQPHIEDVSTSVDPLPSGNVEYKVTVKAHSNAPVNRIELLLDCPDGTTKKVRKNVTFTKENTEENPEVWVGKMRLPIGANMQEGDCTVREVFVKNEGLLKSPVWEGDDITISKPAGL